MASLNAIIKKMLLDKLINSLIKSTIVPLISFGISVMLILLIFTSILYVDVLIFMQYDDEYVNNF